MDIKTTLLILVNLVLIECLIALQPAWALGTFVSKLSKINSKDSIVFTFVSFQLLKILLFIFFYYLFASKLIIVGCILISLIGFIPFKKEINRSFQYVLLFLMLVSILIMDQPFMGYYDSVPYPFSFTTNWYLIEFSYTIGIIVFWVILSWSAKRSSKNKLVRWCGYIMLVLIVVDSVFSDFLFPFIWDPSLYEDREILYSIQKYLNYFLLVTAVLLLLKYFIDWWKARSIGKV